MFQALLNTLLICEMKGALIRELRNVTASVVWGTADSTAIRAKKRMSRNLKRAPGVFLKRSRKSFTTFPMMITRRAAGRTIRAAMIRVLARGWAVEMLRMICWEKMMMTAINTT